MQFFADPRLLQAMILFIATLLVITLGVFFVTRFRDSRDDDQLPTSDALTKFREMHARGDLSDEEFRTIKTRLASQLQAELNDSNKTG